MRGSSFQGMVLTIRIIIVVSVANCQTMMTPTDNSHPISGRFIILLARYVDEAISGKAKLMNAEKAFNLVSS